MKFTVRWSRPKKFEEGNFSVDCVGVYLIGYRDTSTNKRYVSYVGQGEIGTRLSDHYNKNRCVRERVRQQGRVSYYRYAECEDEDDRLDIELGLYRKHGGSEKLCNENEPPGSSRYETIHIEEIFPT